MTQWTGLPATFSSFTGRFDEAVRERRRAEAVLTSHGANAPTQRTTGLHSTGGCSDAVQERIAGRAVLAAPE
ncbi:hypothetical protein M2351_008507 [Azospirillum canadense]|nr:hypothetical protein [Azospirillum canadense]